MNMYARQVCCFTCIADTALPRPFLSSLSFAPGPEIGTERRQCPSGNHFYPRSPAIQYANASTTARPPLLMMCQLKSICFRLPGELVPARIHSIPFTGSLIYHDAGDLSTVAGRFLLFTLQIISIRHFGAARGSERRYCVRFSLSHQI